MIPRYIDLHSYVSNVTSNNPMPALALDYLRLHLKVAERHTMTNELVDNLDAPIRGITINSTEHIICIMHNWIDAEGCGQIEYICLN